MTLTVTPPKLPVMTTVTLTFPFSFNTYSQPNGVLPKIFGLPERRHRLRLVGRARASLSRAGQGSFDPELRSVLELATDSELFELEDILFGPSYFSPLLKSITSRSDVDYAMIDKDLQERENFIVSLESRFLFLAADARSTLRGWRPSYRNVLLAVRKELNIPCSNKLSTEDLEAEIFLHLLQEYSSEELEASSGLISNTEGGLELGLSGWKVQALSAIKEFQSVILKGGGIVTLAKIYQLLSKRLSGKLFLEAAKCQMRKEFIKKGGQLAAINLESRAALLAAKQGLKGAASRYLGFRSMMTLLGPIFLFLSECGLGVIYIAADDILDVVWRMWIQWSCFLFVLDMILEICRLWGTFLADVVIQMLGTDYARILRAIYAFAQIRITRTYKLSTDDE